MLGGKSNVGHTHTKTDITDYQDYVLPVANSSTLGGVKVGSNITKQNDGTISVTNLNISGALGFSPVGSDTIYEYDTEVNGKSLVFTETITHTNNTNQYQISLQSLGITASSTEINTLDGASGNIQSQINEDKSNIQILQSSVSSKASQGYVDEGLDSKADLDYVDSELDSKADLNYVNNRFSTLVRYDSSNENLRFL